MNHVRWSRAITALVVVPVALACAEVDYEELERVETPAVAEEEDSRFVKAQEPIPNRYIVVLDDKTDFRAQSMEDMSTSLAQRHRASVLTTYSAAINAFVAEMDEEDARRLSREPGVAFVEEDGVMYKSAVQTGATWGLDRIDQASGTNGSYEYSYDGTGVTAYVIDTGVKVGHTDFGGRASHGYTAVNDGMGSDDCDGHGTHVAGTIGGATWGVAKNVKIVAVRVLGCGGSGSTSGVIAGVDWVAQNAQLPAVANMSLGGGASAALDSAVRRAVQAGVVFAVAAGNESTNACSGSPSRVPEALTVGSSTSSNTRSSFSNYGSCVDIFAPGSNIKSAWIGSNSATSTISGTSMASPHVAGAAALVLDATPNATPAQVATSLLGNSTANALSSVGTGSPNKLLYVGYLGGVDPGPDPDPTPDPDPDPTPGGTPKSGSATGSLTGGAADNFQPLTVLPGTALTVSITGTGDADLYVRFGAAPTTTTYACRPYLYTSNETCSLTVPAGQTQAYIMVRGYSNASYTLEADWFE